MITVVRALFSIFLLAVILFCLYGIAATFEPLPPATQWTWRGIYALIFAANGYALYRLWRR